MGGCVDVREARLGGDEAVEAAGLTTTADDGRAARPDGKGTGCATVTAIGTVSDGRADGGTVRIPVHSHAAEVRTVSRRRGRPLRAEAAAEAADAGSIHAGGNAPPGRRAVGSSHGDRCFGVGSERGVLELKRPRLWVGGRRGAHSLGGGERSTLRAAEGLLRKQDGLVGGPGPTPGRSRLRCFCLPCFRLRCRRLRIGRHRSEGGPDARGQGVGAGGGDKNIGPNHGDATDCGGVRQRTP